MNRHPHPPPGDLDIGNLSLQELPVAYPRPMAAEKPIETWST